MRGRKKHTLLKTTAFFRGVQALLVGGVAGVWLAGCRGAIEPSSREPGVQNTPGASSSTGANSPTGANSEDSSQPEQPSPDDTWGVLPQPTNVSEDGGSSAQSPAGVCPDCGPSVEEFFAPGKLATLRIEISDEALGRYAREDWLDELWRVWDHCKPFTFVPARMTYESPDGVGSVTLDNVGMRLRGSWKRGTNEIQGFKLDPQVFDSPGPEGKRRFADLNRINILSIEDDPSHMTQCLAYRTLRDAGLPAPRCNHLKVYVNGVFYGLLENVEQVNHGFVRRHFGTNVGHLYGGSPSSADCPDGFQDSRARLQYSGDAFSNYRDQYELTVATESDAEADLIPALKCGDPKSTPDDAAFRACISDWLDVDAWLTQIAGESVMPTLESLIGYYRNFYLYFRPEPQTAHGGRFVIWSWDLDRAFGKQHCFPSNCDVFTAVSSLFGPRNARAPLIKRLTSVFHPEYCSALRRYLTAYNPALVDQMAQVMEPGMNEDTSVSTWEWTAAVNELRTYMARRKQDVEAQIATSCP